MTSWLVRVIAIGLALLLSSCGGGGAEPTDTARSTRGPHLAYNAALQKWIPQPSSPATTFVYLASDVGDHVGSGAEYLYTTSDASISVTFSSGYLQVKIVGDQWWNGNFKMPTGVTTLQEGTYTGLGAYLHHDPAVGGFAWIGEGRACYDLTAWVTITNVVYRKAHLQSFDVVFEQRCDGDSAALRGLVHWDASDKPIPAGYLPPAPEGLWSAPPGATPATGNYVYVVGDDNDFIVGPESHLYTQANAILSVAREGSGGLKIEVEGDENWVGIFVGPSNLTQLKVGYYGWVMGYPFSNPLKGGLDWEGEGRGCNSLWGWFAIDEVSYASNGTIASLQMRFAQDCEAPSANRGTRGLLYGQIRWSADDPTVPPGPVSPPPDGLWQPAAGAAPSSGTYVFLENDRGIGDSQWIERHTYTHANSVLSMSLVGAKLEVQVVGDEGWDGTFQGMSSISTLQVGYYGSLQRWPFHNPAKGGIDAGACNRASGWFVIDELRFTNGSLQFLKMRFLHYCDASTKPLRGQIQWDANDTSRPSGPVTPIPGDLWKPDAGATPLVGNYIYLKSEPGDYIGRGQTFLHTDQIQVYGNNPLTIYGGGWTGRFAPMNSLSQLQVGYYPDLQRFPFHNPVKGGLSWSGESRGCNELTGWFAVDQITVVNGVTSAIKIRFEQRCDPSAPLRGEIRWSR